MSQVHIRQEISDDYQHVRALVKAAFADLTYSDQTEHFLVERLRNAPTFIPELSLVAEVDGQVVGHILLTRILIQGDRMQTPSLALAPVSVHPDFQGQGIGGALIRTSHEIAQQQGYHSIILLGHEDYYPRFGYQPTADFGIQLPFEAPPQNCMLIELQPGCLDKVSGVVEYPPEFME